MILHFLIEICSDSARFPGLDGAICSEHYQKLDICSQQALIGILRNFVKY